MTFDECFDVVMEIEGGGKLVENSADNGGLTKWGIARNAHPELSAADIRSLTKIQAKVIYKSDYWDPLKTSKFANRVRLAIFDSAVNHGLPGAAKLIQKAANSGGAKLKVDGEIGAMTLAAVKAIPAVDFLVLLSAERLALYQAHEDFASFGKGWTKRLFKIAVCSA